MSKHPIWNLLLKVFSLLSVAFLVLGAVLVNAGSLGLPENEASANAILIFGAVAVIASMVALHFANFSIRNELNHASRIANQLAEGDLIEDDEEIANSDLMLALSDISGYMSEKCAVADQIAVGNLSSLIILRSDADKFGHSFQNMADQLRELVQTQEKRERLQQSILKLLEEVSEVAAGDLTVQAEVSPEMTGDIAEAFNSMTKELRSLIKQVKDVTFQVSTSANSINDTTEQLARGSEAQASQISRTTSAISNMAVQIQEVSENASLSAQVASESLNNARYGSKAVQDNINAMNGIRKQVQETAKRIKKLGERSQEISQIVTLIDDLSERTSLLALNASLQASAAGESGRGFAFVAEEVERLAERSNHLTQQIAGLAQSIQVETKDVVASMEETIHEVVVGSTLADNAGQALVEIEQVSTRLAELIESISSSAKQQAQTSDDISKAMTNISKVTELVNVGSNRAAHSVKKLVDLSDELRGSVAPFKLPEDGFVPRRMIAQDAAAPSENFAG
ncbi:MAG: methyl-accepting chemotaxis protein [Acidobacteriota bacterium]|nr:methyl-accepting chemotaxis protein [Acidobacteriota bacterium]MDH3530291.1 methyl-accepting chemotaxis protein [Acidobacteriota bacterium]